MGASEDALEPGAKQFKGDGLLLEHGDRIAIGRLIFVFIDPAMASIEILVLSGQVSYMNAVDELEKVWRRHDNEANQTEVEKQLRALLAERDKELEELREE